MAKKIKLKPMSLEEFSKKMFQLSQDPTNKVVFYLGSGCSVTSGIHSGTQLVQRWLRQQYQEKYKATFQDKKDILPFEKWVVEKFPGYSEQNAGEFYPEVMDWRFRSPVQKQVEIEEIVRGAVPGTGYYALAKLMENHGEVFNRVLTTNFDDLVADAFYLYTNVRPLVIGHHALTDYIRHETTRPTIFKLHGDYRLTPINSRKEQDQLPKPVIEQLQEILHFGHLVFLGYAGMDKRLTQALEEMPEGLKGRVFWVSDNKPNGEFGQWLKKVEAYQIKFRDFDLTMLALFHQFNLEQFNKDKIADRLFDKYKTTFEQMSQKIRFLDDKILQEFLSLAYKTAGAKFDNWITAYLQAYDANAKGETKEAERIYLDGLHQFPNSAELSGAFADFLKNVRSDYDQAEVYYRRSLDSDPKDADHLGNYALFLEKVRQDYDQAEVYYRWALEANPTHANNLGNWATFLKNVRQDYDQAEQYYLRALEADPKQAGNLGNYALFLEQVRKDYDQAEHYYLRGLEADPKQAVILGNYASFLHAVRQDYDQAEVYYLRSLEADPKQAKNLGNFALFLEQARQDYPEAEKYYRRSLEADPEHNNNLSNFAGFLLGLGQREEGKERLAQAFAALQAKHLDPAELECRFYHYAHFPAEALEGSLARLKELLKQGTRAAKNWPLAAHVEQAEKAGHPELEFLEALRKVVKGLESLESLDRWPFWKTL